ncbi:hypothetical protein AAE02nite_45830 [Adhaeribacter aerolatus]|uniref:Uncharacterized protein n=1 Tax=Adhaeribacter aerolatus TaxID=670289 RepID=A0A512B4N3_9BACT|nr:hypothetical protein [Adhaeribacter aerolatus]GEO06919.1 hypothetical protein AAE02nite_45830 [Adhaeribacter aerolatus]
MAILKEDLHKLIDTTQDEKLLEEIFMILSSRNSYVEGDLWNNLSEEQKKEVLASNSEIEDDSAWISNEEMKLKNAKWLE